MALIRSIVVDILNAVESVLIEGYENDSKFLLP